MAPGVAWSFENPQISISSFLIIKKKKKQIKIKTKWKQYDCYANALLQYM